jgi:hypothetical protein
MLLVGCSAATSTSGVSFYAAGLVIILIASLIYPGFNVGMVLREL